MDQGEFFADEIMAAMAKGELPQPRPFLDEEAFYVASKQQKQQKLDAAKKAMVQLNQLKQVR